MLRVFVGLFAFVLSGPAFAGFAQTSAPAGWGGSPSQWTFNPPANSPWANGSAAGGVTQNVGGRAINMPAAMRMAANAGSYAAKAARITPGGIITAAVAAWLLEEGISWVADHWQSANGPVSNGTYYCVPNSNCAAGTTNRWASMEEAIQAFKTALCAGKTGCVVTETWKGYAPVSGNTGSITEGAGFNWTRTANGYSPLTGQNRWTAVCPGGGNYLRWTSWSTPYTCSGQTQESAPATDTDWSRFNNKPVPDQVANDLDAPMPVGLPALNPDPAGNPQPYRVPVGDPQAMPGTDPATVKQPVVDIVPKPTLDEPWRVDVQPKEIIGTDPNGQQQPGTVPSGEPAPTPLTPEQVQLCEAYPDIAACQPLGKVDDVPVIPTETKQLEIEPYGGFGPSTAACPAPRTVSLRGGTFSVSMPFDLLCDFADGIRPIVVGLAWLASVLAWLGLSRKD